MNETARARSELYGLFAELLSFPTEQLAEACNAGDVERSLTAIASVLPFTFQDGLAGALTDPGLGHVDLQSEYIRLFDLPGGGPSMPLYAGVFAPSRRDSMEELLRFYRHFGLTVSTDERDLPDAIPTVLEFLHFLSFREASLAVDEDAAPLHGAQADVLGRHLVRWTTEAASRIEGKDAMPFYRSVIHLLNEFCGQELQLLQAAA